MTKQSDKRQEMVIATAKTIREAIEPVEQLRDQLQEWMDNASERTQEGERYEATEETVNQLSDAVESSEAAADALDGVSFE